MSLQLRYPNITGRTPEERQQQMERHVRSMIDQLNLFLKKSGETEDNSQTGNFEEALNSKISKTEKDLSKQIKEYFDKLHPVGSIYLSVSATNPSTLFGGTWEQIEDRFLLAAGSSYKAGDTGGEANHTLTVNEMPSHEHDGITWAGYSKVSGNAGSDTHLMRLEWNAGLASSTGFGTLPSGGSQAHNNMPPYLAVYVWKRIK